MVRGRRCRRPIAHGQRPLERRLLPPLARRDLRRRRYWRPEKPWLDAFRRRVADEPAEFRRLLDAKPFRDTFGGLSQDGHALQRVPSGFPPDHPEAETLKLKDVVFGRRLSDDEAQSASLPATIATIFEAGVPVWRWLAALG